MENAEEVLQSLDEFAKLKPKDIPRELEDYLSYVAKTGDPVYQWSIVKCLFREKLLNVITEFYETSPTIDLPPCPNVDPFNYETMKSSLIERLDSFPSAPFTVQRLCELLTTPRKEYSRADKFMRAIEKNILVVSTREPGNVRRNDNNGQPELLMNGVMDGRGIELGEAIETVSSDGVNLMHADENEVNVTENENMSVECSGMEDVDMEEQNENSNACNSNTWEKEHTDVPHQNEDGIKSYNSSEVMGSKIESSEGNNAEKDSENSVQQQSTSDSSENSTTVTADEKTAEVSAENCKETSLEMTETKDEIADVNPVSEQEVESHNLACEESSEKSDEKDSNATGVSALVSVEEVAPEKPVSRQKSSNTNLDSSNSEVCNIDTPCTVVDRESETSNVTESTNKTNNSHSEIAEESDDVKKEAAVEVSVASPPSNAIVEVTDDVNKENESESIVENETIDKPVTDTKEHIAASCPSPERNEIQPSTNVDVKSEESKVNKDIEAKENVEPTSESQTESTGPEEAMEVEINAAAQATEEVQGCDEPMDQTEQPSEGAEEEGKS